MLLAASLLSIPLALATSAESSAPPSYHQVRAYVTGYNTVPGQTDDTPCTAASGADICGRRDAVACPRPIAFGTVVEIRGATYVCEDRLARKFDSRFDISCDKDVACPPTVTGWATINIYGDVQRLQPELVPAVWHHTGNRRLWWARPARAVSSLWPAIIRTPSSSLAAIVARVPISRKATRFVRHAWNTRSRAALISRG